METGSKQQQPSSFYPSDPNLALEWDGTWRGAASERYAGPGAGVGAVQAWISIGLGLAGLFWPRATARMSGLPHWPTTLRMIGARELASGIGLLAQPTSPAWRWARIAGDAMDGAVIGAAFFAPGSRRRKLAVTAALIAGVVALDLYAGGKTATRAG